MSKIDFQNDIVFKKTLGDDDSKEFLIFFIRTYTNKEFSDYEVTNKENLGKYVNSKKNYIDIKAINEQGEITIIEMQRSRFSKVEADRFLFYPSNEFVNQVNAGDHYSSMKEIIEIIVTPDKVGDVLVNTYKLTNQNNVPYPSNKLSIIIISLANLEVELTNDQELLAYAYKYSSVRDIIDLANSKLREMLIHMECKLDEINGNDIYLSEAKLAAFNEANQRANNELIYYEGKIEGKIEMIEELCKNNGMTLEQALKIAKLTKEQYDTYLMNIETK